MATMVPAQKNVEYIFFVGLVSQADTKLLQNNPTLASGDVLVSTDGGGTSTLDTLPAVTPASSDMVKVTVSTTEMNGDNVIIVFSDAAGSEWCDLLINIQTAAQSLDTTDAAVDTNETKIDTIDANIDIVKAGCILLSTTIGSNNRATTTCELVAGSDNNDAYNGMLVVLDYDAGDGEYVSRTITDYVGASKTVTWAPAITEDAEDGGNIYIIPAHTAQPWNPTWDAEVESEATDALNAYDPPTRGELTTDKNSIITEVDANETKIDALNNISTSDVNAEVVDVLETDTHAEPGSVLVATASLKDKICWLAALARNKITQTSTVQTLRNDADDGSISTAAVADDGTTATRSEWS